MERPKSEKLQELRDMAEANKDEIRSLYLAGHSINWILSKFGIGSKRRQVIEEVLIGIELRGLKGNGKKIQRALAKETSLKLYGVENASSSLKIKEKRKQTFLRRYGVENPFQHAAFKEKMQATWIKNYGVPYSSASPACQAGLKSKRSRPHKILESCLEQEGIKFKSEEEIRGFKNGKLYRPRADLLLDGFAIEIYGDYFHANPIKYRSTDLIKRFNGYCTAKEIWEADAARVKFIEDQGVKVLIIWEQDIKINLKDVIQRIKNEASTNS